MSEHHQVSVPDLIKITRKLIKTELGYNMDFYSLLLLALVTVNEYSQKIHFISLNYRINLAITFIPDLINFLQRKKVIPEELAVNFELLYKDREKEVRSIMRSYISAGKNLKTKMDPDVLKKSSSDCKIQ